MNDLLIYIIYIYIYRIFYIKYIIFNIHINSIINEEKKN